MPEVFSPMEDILGEPYNFDHVMNIPLVIHVPGSEINETISKVGSQIDFFPTILNIMGLKNEKGLMMGQDLVNSQDYNFVPAQTIIRKGSFIDEDVIFNISQDGIFENSRVTDRKTRKELDVADYREEYERAISEINLSDFILRENLFQKLEEVDWDLAEVDLDFQSQKLPAEQIIEVFNPYTIKDLDQAYRMGKRIMRINIDWRTNLKELEAWMMKNKDAYLILKTDEETTETLERVKDEFPDLRKRYIGEIDDLTKHFLVQRKGYKNIILNIKDKEYGDQEILDFLNMHKHYGVIMDKSRSKTKLPKKLKKMQVKTYIEDKEKDQIKLYKPSIFSKF